MYMNSTTSWLHAHILVYIPNTSSSSKKLFLDTYCCTLNIFKSSNHPSGNKNLYAAVKSQMRIVMLITGVVYSQYLTKGVHIVEVLFFFHFLGVLIHFIPLLKSMFILSIKYTRGLKYFFINDSKTCHVFYFLVVATSEKFHWYV